MGGSEEIGLLK